MSPASKLAVAVRVIAAAGARFTMDGEPMALGDFIHANGEAPELVEWVDAMAHLRPGESMVTGGGAGASFIIARATEPGDDECAHCGGKGSLPDGTPFRVKCDACRGEGVLR